MMRPWVVGVGWDDRRRGHGVEGGAWLGVGRERWDIGGVLGAIRAGRGSSAVSALIHAVAQQIKLGLEEGKEGEEGEEGGKERRKGTKLNCQFKDLETWCSLFRQLFSRCPVTSILKGQPCWRNQKGRKKKSFWGSVAGLPFFF